VIAVDTSAIVAVIKHEPEEARIHAALQAADISLISTASLLDLQLVLAGRRALGIWYEVELILREHLIQPRPFDERQLTLAREAAIRYGKGRHRAALNFGDCFAYALAKSEDIPLLCTGGDFALTDVAIAR